MERLDHTYVATGLLWVVLGMVFGIWLGITEQFNFANSHAHMNLVGFVISVLFGLMHRGFPGLGRSRLAKPQYLVYQLGAVLLVAGKIVVDAGGAPVLVAIGSLVVVLGTVMMLVMFLRHGKEA